MKVISRTNGPKFINGTLGKDLKAGKSYDVISWSYPNSSGYWITSTDDFINTNDPKFYVKVINEYGIESVYWNDYFLSTEEIREFKLTELGV